MRNFLLTAAVAASMIVGCSGMFQRQGASRPLTPTPAAPGDGRLSPVPDLGQPAPLPSNGPTLEGPVFPETSRRRMRTVPASAQRGRMNPVPLTGYYELPPAP